MRLSKHFDLEELVHSDIIGTLGEIRSANLVNIYLIKTLELLRSRFGPIIINNTRFKNSGIRKSSYYKNKFGLIRQSYSTHQWGNTADLKFKDADASDVYDHILLNPRDFPNVVRLENAHETKLWLHIECGKYRDKEIEVFNP